MAGLPGAPFTSLKESLGYLLRQYRGRFPGGSPSADGESATLKGGGKATSRMPRRRIASHIAADIDLIVLIALDVGLDKLCRDSA